MSKLNSSLSLSNYDNDIVSRRTLYLIRISLFLSAVETVEPKNPDEVVSQFEFKLIIFDILKLIIGISVFWLSEIVHFKKGD